jgi:hypothetical protein
MMSGLSGSGAGMGPGGSTAPDEEEGKTVFDVYQFDFIVQLAWIPRTPQERIEARTKRLEELAKQQEEQQGQAPDEPPAGEAPVAAANTNEEPQPTAPANAGQ